MNFDIKSVLGALDKGLTLAKELAPLVPGLGGAAAASNIVSGVIEIGQKALEHIENGKIVATTDDQEQIKALITRLQVENDENARIIRES